MDSPSEGSFRAALLIDSLLLAAFALQHSIMARPGFKRILTRYIPQAAERSTYVLASSLALILLFWQWRPLGGVIWSQVAAGLYQWRNIRLEFTQAMTNKAPCSPNRGYSRMQQLWFTERVIDIVAHELGLDPVEVRKKNYIRAEDMPYETPNGCVYDSGDYAAMLDKEIGRAHV